MSLRSTPRQRRRHRGRGRLHSADLGIEPFQSMANGPRRLARPAWQSTGALVRRGNRRVMAETMVKAKDAADMVMSTTTCCRRRSLLKQRWSWTPSAAFERPRRQRRGGYDRPVNDDLSATPMSSFAVATSISASPLRDGATRRGVGIDDDGRLVCTGHPDAATPPELMSRALGSDKSEIRVSQPLVGVASAVRPGIYRSKWWSLLRPDCCSDVVWAATRSEDMLALSHRSRSDSIRRTRLQARWHVQRACGFAWSVMAAPTRASVRSFTVVRGAGRTALSILRHPVRRRRRRHQTTLDGATRGAGRRGDGPARADRRPSLDRVGHRSDRTASSQPLDDDVFPSRR